MIDPHRELLAELPEAWKPKLNGLVLLFDETSVYAWEKETPQGGRWFMLDVHAHAHIRIAAENMILQHGWLIWRSSDGLFSASPGFSHSVILSHPAIEAVLLAAVLYIKEKP